MRPFLLLLPILLLISCNKKLTREQAAEEIKKKYALPIPKSVEFAQAYNINVPGGNPNNISIPGRIGSKEIKRLQRLLDKNLISVKMEDRSHSVEWFFKQIDIPMTHYEFSLTSETQNYLTGSGKKWDVNDENLVVPTIQVKAFEQSFGEITGMVEQEGPVKSVIVDFTTIRTNPTPFAEVFDIDMGVTSNEQVTFVKSDDGWRIE